MDPNSPLGDDEMVLASSCPKKRAGRKKFKETRHPIYRGVRQRHGNRWVCEVRAPNSSSSRIWLGTYPTADMAARAHDVAALALKGRAACLNFADSAWRLRVPASTDTRDIQKAAAQAAEGFRDPEDEVIITTDNVNLNLMDVSANEGSQFMDEEAVYDMPGLLINMAQGLLLPPPHTHHNDDDDYHYDYHYDDSQLWSYSM